MGTGSVGTPSQFPDTPTLLGGVFVGLGVAATLRQGAFYSTSAAIVALVALTLGLIRFGVGPRPPARALGLPIAATALAAWWLVRAGTIHDIGAFLPLGASIVVFAGAFVVSRGLPAFHRELAASALLAVGAISGLLGTGAVLLRWTPLAIPSQSLWRVATTLTYANAAGALLALSLLVGLALSADSPWVRLALFLCLASLLATQSRGAILGTAVALVLVPWSQMRLHARTLVLGAIAGLVTIALSPGRHGHPLGLVLLAVLTAAASSGWPGARTFHLPGRRRAFLGLLLPAVGVVTAATVLHTPITRRLQLASTEERGSEWTAAFKQWRSSPVIGTGPDRLLHVVARDGNVAHFAHNEYLQVLAGGGLVGELLLLILGVTVIRAVTRSDVLSSCAAAAVLSFALAGALDFIWHLPALCLWAGWAAGLAGPIVSTPSSPPTSTSPAETALRGPP